ncbi:unnamed protein product, partial [Rotaria sp. Silwood1]
MSNSLGNYELKDSPRRSGPGEGGVAVIPSDKVSMDKHIKDTRPAERKNWIYPNTQYLPTASIILVFYDEGWNVLLRTVHSVINTSSPELLKEVVFVDDGSSDG